MPEQEAKVVEIQEEKFVFIKPEPIEVQKVKLISEGDELDAKITKIVLGRVEDFIPIDQIRDEVKRERLMQIKDRPAIYVEFEVPELGVRGKDIVIFSYDPKSKYVRLARRYGELAVGMAVKVVAEGGKLKLT